MRCQGVLRHACLASTLLLVLVPVASAHSIEIKFAPGTAGANGTIHFTFDTDNSGILGLASTSVKVRSGWSDSTIANFMALSLNASVFAPYYTAVAGTETLGTTTFSTVTIIPIAGQGDDFNSGSFDNPPGKDPQLPGMGVGVLAAVRGTASLQLTADAASNPALSINWELFVVNQTGNVDGTVTLASVPDTTSAAALIGMFDTALVNQGISAVANGDTLSLTTSDNDFFALTRSAAGSLDFYVSDSVATPEPGTMTLLASGLLGMAGVVCRRIRKNA